jgi:hypothetical protein
MLHLFTGPSQLDSYRKAVAGCALSPRAAAVVLHCSPEHVRHLVSRDELEAWAYRAGEGAPVEHYRVSVP